MCIRSEINNGNYYIRNAKTTLNYLIRKKELDKERDYHLAIYRNSDQYRLMKDQIPQDLLDEDKIKHIISLLYSGKETSLDDVYGMATLF